MHDEKQLVRGLSLRDTTALVIGTVIGTGVFLKAAPMAQYVGTPQLVLLAWVAAGFLSLAGAFTYAELGAMFPEAGGEYVFLKKSYGQWAAFLFGWQRFLVAGSAAIASLGVGVAIFLSAIFPMDQVFVEQQVNLLGKDYVWQFGIKQLVAVSVIMALTVINCATILVGGRIQSILTILKVSGICFVIFGVLFASRTATWSHFVAPTGTPEWSGFALFGSAMLAALWGYDGWNTMPMVAGEVRDPGKNIPRALILGMVSVMIIYCSMNFCYFYALPFDAVVTSNSTLHPNALPVAAKASQTFLGDYGGKLISIAFIISAIGALNGSIIAGARVPYAMAKDGLFFRSTAMLSSRTRVPLVALLVQGLWSSLLAVSGTFDQLTDCLLFASWIFYGLVCSSVFVLRFRMPDAPRPYRTVGYPVVPIVFLMVSIWLIVNTLFAKPVESTVGLVLIALGIPAYVYFRSTIRPEKTV